MKKFIYSMSALFVVAIAIVIGLRMSPDAVAVIIGIICGMVATVPTTFLLIYTLRQRDRQQMLSHQHHQGSYYPPVVVVNGQGQPTSFSGNPGGLGHQNYLPSSEGGRSFKVVGQEATPTETLGEAFGLSSIWDDNN